MVVHSDQVDSIGETRVASLMDCSMHEKERGFARRIIGDNCFSHPTVDVRVRVGGGADPIWQRPPPHTVIAGLCLSTFSISDNGVLTTAEINAAIAIPSLSTMAELIRTRGSPLCK